ncbi:S8 family serine peptidase [uncultured Piscinibacter sp.]|uniref:S8 family peptidase n=1 Tax=uncultured Piscinibacter sp. TaxID=1131835 RepID=UPI00261E4481|nr:S8 family serine peptidase [uncultured Piscinibacter sp.]
MAAQRATLAEADALLASDRMAIKSAASLRAGVAEHRLRIRDAQGTMAAQLSALGGKELARVQNAHNAIAVSIDAAQLERVAALSGVAKVRPVLDYQLDLSATVPYVGATAVQSGGVDGSGVTVAVLDSGIDDTHRNLGGEGTAAAYAAAYGTSTSDPANTTLDGLFPTAKVVAGYDFVGESCPKTPEAADPDPIDLEGHGTHVADIIAGRSQDGSHKGVAPGAKLVAVKVCSAVATSCSGIALLQGMDFALDPNGDGDTSDAVDVINMSLGSSYGQIEDDLTLAATNAVRLGVVVVASAGNSANKPYVVGSPSIAPGVISVAQTEVPGAVAIPLMVNSPASIAGTYANTQTMDWAPVGAGVSGDVVFVGRACPGDALLASPAGKIALVDRGACAISLKVDVAADAGATGVLVGLVAPGDAVSFSYGGGDTFVPSLVIRQTLSSAIKGRLTAGDTVNLTISPAGGIPLVGSMAATSSRGPSISAQSIKPEIGAPGASLSAEAGTGDGQTVFGGTSGAAPMVSGGAALLLQAFPNRRPEQIKAMLMNSAETTIYTNPALLPGQLAPITRIGAGEMRVDRALALSSLAYSRESKSASLSFGTVDASGPVVIEKKLRIENLSRQSRSYSITPSFRYADDQASGAVRVVVKPFAHVSGRSHEEITVKLVIDPTKLPEWTLNGGPQGGNGAALNGPEYDGYLTLNSGGEKLTVPWHVLPRKATEASAELSGHGNPGPSLKLRNRGVEVSAYEVFSLTGQSTKIPKSEIPGPGSNQAVIDMRSVGVRYLPDVLGPGADVLEFAINTNGRRAHPNYPAEFDIEIDANADGTPDYVAFNAENGGFAASGQNLVFLVDLRTGSARAFFFTDADLNSGNVIFSVPVNAGAGTMAYTRGATIGFSVYAFDTYFSGINTDAIEGMRFTPGQQRFGVVGDVSGTLEARGAASVGVTTATLPDTLSSERGLLLMYRRNAGKEADAIRIR